jgi:hypothetical protein
MTAPYEPRSWIGDFVERAAADGMHALLRTGLTDHRIWMPEPIAPGEPVACVLPLGGDAAAGAAAAVDFWRDISGVRAKHAALDTRLERLKMILFALDGRAAGANYRALAERLFGEDRIEDRTWKTSSVRDATIRLVRSGLAYVNGNYRRLLRH